MLSTEVADLKAHMAANPGAVIEDVARERKVSPRAVLEAMPETMVRVSGGWHAVGHALATRVRRGSMSAPAPLRKP